MLPAIGQMFGPYEILALLGGGGMGVVFRAWDERLHREVAIKLLHDQHRPPGMRERFLLEARAASALAHPHICTIFDIGEQDGEPYLVMELLEGSTLKQIISQRACSADEVVRYGEQMAEALRAAHSKGIVHRDIKPANVFLQKTPGGEFTVKILDFGLAKVSMALRSGRDSRALELTSAGFTVGTLAYMSPEQARGEALDARTDLFSLGVVMYEMATRRTPFRGATTGLAFESLLGEPPDPIRKWNVTVPRELERIIGRLLQKERSRRFPDAGAVRDELAKLLARGGGEWLRKLPVGVVPLVAAADPVARKPRTPIPKTRQATLPEIEVAPVGESVGSVPSAVAKTPGEVEGVLRPWRFASPEREVQASSSALAEVPSAAAVMGVAADRQVKAPEGIGAALSKEQTEERRSFEAEAVVGEATADTVDDPDAGALGVATREMRETVLPQPQPAMPEVSTPVGQEKAAPAMPAITDPSFRRPQRSQSSTRLAAASVPAHTEASSNDQSTATTTPQVATTRAGTSGRTRWAVIAALLVICGAVTVLVFELRSGSLGNIVLGPNASVLLGPIANRTGDAGLDGVVAEGLQLSLGRRSRVHWLDADALAAGDSVVSQLHHLPEAQVSAQSVAQQLGARAYVAGEITDRHGQETIRLDIIDASSNDRLGSLTQTAADSHDVPGAVARLADALRAKLGDVNEPAGSAPGVMLDLPSTSGVSALNAFARGETARISGDLPSAAAYFRDTVALAPQFTSAHLRLAMIYERMGAELPAAESAGRALATSSGEAGRVQLIARATAQLLRDNDPVTALVTLRRGIAQWPDDVEMLTLLAHVMRVSGRMTEALLVAEKALAQDPYRGDAYREAALALVGQNRGEDALRIARGAEERGVLCDCGALLAQAVSHDEGAQSMLRGLTTPNRQMPKRDEDFLQGHDRALVLDDTGHFAEGLAQWRQAAREAQAEPQLTSAAAGLLATAASDRALAGRCSEAADLAHEASLLAYGRLAAFHIALAGSLCPSKDGGETKVAVARLEEGAKASAFPATMLPAIRAAQALSGHRTVDAVAAISLIPSARDTPPLVSYLRGISLLLSGQRSSATAALEDAAGHDGYALLTDTIVAPLAADRMRRL